MTSTDNEIAMGPGVGFNMILQWWGKTVVTGPFLAISSAGTPNLTYIEGWDY
ncbi:MAG: hypothetical protein OK436_03105 [Thaumarchaeota archaeon]|nr:hypothetical protein [Nitrososphaerota archaeon]